jgi:hypothetical protein
VHVDAADGAVLRRLAAPDDVRLGVLEVPRHDRLVLRAGEHLLADKRQAEHRALVAAIRALPLAVAPHTHTTVSVAGIDELALAEETRDKSLAALALTDEQSLSGTRIDRNDTLVHTDVNDATGTGLDRTNGRVALYRELAAR